MSDTRRPARINTRLIVTIAVVVGVLGAGAVAARKIRSSIIARNALAAGKAAFERGEWDSASKNLREYLSRQPDDPEMLANHAYALLRLRPVRAGSIAGAIDSYRRVLRLPPSDAKLHNRAYDELARLYRATGNPAELAYIADKRLSELVGDPQATIWKVESLILQQRLADARDQLLALVGRLETNAADSPAYVEACGLLSTVEVDEFGKTVFRGSLRALNRGIENGAPSAKLLAARAQLFRQRAALAENSPNQRTADLAAARADLERGCEFESMEPTTRLMLAVEWRELKVFSRARAEFEKADQIDLETIYSEFVDPDDWETVKFRERAELLALSQDREGGVELADRVLNPDSPEEALLKEDRQRLAALPHAVRLYVSAETPRAARRAALCMEEYDELALRYSTTAQTPRGETTLLRALVRRAERRPYRVLRLLEPLTLTNLSPEQRAELLWPMLAEAYRQTRQTRREITALQEFRKLRPNDRTAIRQLVRAYIKQRAWGAAMVAARLVDPEFNADDIELELLRMQAIVQSAASQRTPELESRIRVMGAQLLELRAREPRDVQIRQMQAGLALYLDREEQAERELILAMKECDNPLPAEIQLAELYTRMGRADEAISTCRTACERYPDKSAAWEALGQALVADGRVDEAREAYKSGLRDLDDPREQRLLRLNLARMELVNGDAAEGIAHLREMASDDVEDVRVRRMLLSRKEVRDDLGGALKLVEEIHKTEGDGGVQWRIQKAALLLSGPDWRTHEPEVGELLEYCLATSPKWDGAAALLGAFHQRLGRLGEAEEVYRRVLSLNPGATATAGKLLDLLEGQKRFAEAQEVIKKLEIDPRAVQSRSIRMAASLGDFTEAINELKFRLSGDPTDGPAHLLLARLIYEVGGHDAVEEAFGHVDEAAKYLKGSLAAPTVRVAILRAEDRIDEALKLLDDVVDREQSAEAVLLRGMFRARIDKWEDAETDYVRVAELMEDSGGFALLGYFYRENEQLTDAIGAWERGLAKFEHDPLLQRYLMGGLFTRNLGDDPQRAERLLTELTGRLGPGEKDPDLMVVKANLLLKKQNDPDARREARALLEEVVKLRPGFRIAYVFLISLAHQRRDFEAVRDLAIRSLASNPNDKELLMARAEAEWRLENPATALSISRMVLEDHPDYPAAGVVLVSLALQSDDESTLREALAVVEQNLSDSPADERQQISRARLLTGLGETQQAVSSLAGFADAHPDTCGASAFLVLAGLHLSLGQHDDALSSFRRAFENSPGDQDVFALRVKWLAIQDPAKIDEMIALVDAYIERFPKQIGVPIQAANTLSQVTVQSQGGENRDSISKAREWMEQACRAAPDSSMARILLAHLVYQGGDVSLAKQLYGEVLTLEPDNVAALNDLAWCTFETASSPSDYEAALQLADRGVEIKPNDAALRDTRGEVLARIPGRLRDARVDFEKRLELVSGNEVLRAKALLKVARVCLDLGDLAAGQRNLNEALRIDRRRDDALTADERSALALLQRRAAIAGADRGGR